MQGLGAVTLVELKASVQVPLVKLEIYYGGAWVNLCSLGGVNYLKDFSLSLGGATMTPDPVAGTWSATIHNTDGAFLPANTGGAYYDYFTTGTLVRISTGGTYGGGDVYWERLIGVMDAPQFSITPPEVKLKGMDYSQYLADYKLRTPNNYWGESITISTIGPTESLGAEIYDEADACEIGAHEADNVANWARSVAAVSSIADALGGSVYAMKILFGSGAVTKTYSTKGSFIWTCPTGVTSVQAECWGAGGGGAGVDIGGGSNGGGGGGGYSKSTAITVVPGTDYVVTVGARGNGGVGFNDGEDGGVSYFKNLSTTKAAGGKGGLLNGSGGDGGSSGSGVGDTKYSGGDGGLGDGTTGGGGGGGSSAGTAANGNDGGDGTAGGGGAGGAAPAGGGIGGAGGDHDDNGHSPISGAGGGGGASGSHHTLTLDGGDGEQGKVILSYTGAVDIDSIINTNVGAVTADVMYKVTFKYRRITGPGTMAARAYIGTTRQEGEVTDLEATVYTSATFYFTAAETGDLKLYFDITDAATGTHFRVDQISIKSVTSIVYTRNYALPDEATGIYYATLDEGGGAGAQPIYYGEDPDGWFYDSVHNEFVFHDNRDVQGGTDNLVVYYHTAQLPEHVVADILVSVGRYADRVTALAAMTYTETGVVIDRVWFEPGNSALKAIQMICERCNYRFYFKYDGTPAFIPEPEMKAAGAEDVALEECHVADLSYYEDAGEIFNVVSVDGDDIAQPLGPEQTMANNYTGTATDTTSVTAYGDRTKSIKNHLFQSDTVCATMAATLLAAYKDPKKYFDFTAKINAIPIELGDTGQFQIRVVPPTGYGAKYGTFLYGDGTLYGDDGTILALRGKVRDIKLNGADAMYKCELA